MVSPAEAAKYPMLQPANVTPVEILELDDFGNPIAEKRDGEWVDPHHQKIGQIVLRGTLKAGDELPDGSKVVMKRQSGALVFGIIAFGAAYLPAVIAAAASNIDGDRPLAAPIVGPWIMLTTRPQCVVDPTIGPNCVPDTFARFGAVMSGIFQSLGVVFIIAGVPSHAVLEEPTPEDKEEKASIRIVPLGNGVGIQGTF